MKVTNQKPIVLSPIYHDTISNTFDPINFMENIIAKPMFTPLVAGNSVSIKANNQTLSSADITNHMLACCQDAANPTEEAFMKDWFQQTLISYKYRCKRNLCNSVSCRRKDAGTNRQDYLHTICRYYSICKKVHWWSV